MGKIMNMPAKEIILEGHLRVTSERQSWWEPVKVGGVLHTARRKLCIRKELDAALLQGNGKHVRITIEISDDVAPGTLPAFPPSFPKTPKP